MQYSCVIDAIKFFDEYYSNSDFTTEMSAIFNLNDISLKLCKAPHYLRFAIAQYFRLENTNKGLCPCVGYYLETLL